MVRKYWWESPHHVIASACLRSLTQDVGRVSFSNELAIRNLLIIPRQLFVLRPVACPAFNQSGVLLSRGFKVIHNSNRDKPGRCWSKFQPNSSFPSRARAFTLIELLLFIAIIVILVGLLSGPVSRALKKARDADWANKTDPKVEQLVAPLKTHYQ